MPLEYLTHLFDTFFACPASKLLRVEDWEVCKTLRPPLWRPTAYRSCVCAVPVRNREPSVPLLLHLCVGVKRICGQVPIVSVMVTVYMVMPVFQMLAPKRAPLSRGLRNAAHRLMTSFEVVLGAF